ncbi:transposase [Mesorhizobium sp. M0678]|uniref:transposase n=1 Tax=Mesorhizobium sp. M0678 TaxID=2956985 RepID=UPI00333A6949
MINAVRYLVRSGCRLRMLRFISALADGLWLVSRAGAAVSFPDHPRHGADAGPRAGRAGGEPFGAVIDSQSVKAPQARTRGYDAGKKIVGRKRHIAVDTDGRLLMVNLTPADSPTAPALRRFGWYPQALALGEASVR